MNPAEVKKEIERVSAILNAGEYPELGAYFDAVLCDEEPAEDPYEIANRMLACDRDLPLPAAVRTLIEKFYEVAFKAGNAEAANNLGAQYYEGNRGFEQDFTKAVCYYCLAAANGSSQAQENLGYCYYYGRNMPVDYEKAFHYFALGAFCGRLVSLYKIGDMYAAGYYVKKNEKEAFRIYEQCMDRMTDEAAPFVAGPVFLRLGKCFLNGLGTEQDYERALICYQKAEVFLYDMVKKGDAMYGKSLQAAIDGQAKAREKRNQELPGKQWLDGKRD